MSFVGISLFFPSDAHAIIFLPALILIPIAKIVAVIIGGLSLPVLGIGGLLGKITKGSAKRGIFIGIGILVVIAIMLLLLLKLFNPQHPLV